MNGIISRNIESVTEAVLPPRRSDGRLRLLALGLPIMGLRSFNAELERYCAESDDVYAVHVAVHNPLKFKLLSRVPAPWNSDLKVARMGHLWRSAMRAWFRPGGPLDLDRFDAAIVCPQVFGMALADERARGRRFAFAVHIDATSINTVRDFGDSNLTSKPLQWIDKHVFAQADLVSGMGRWATNSARDDFGVPEEKLLWVPPTAPRLPIVERTVRQPGELARIAFVGTDWLRKGGDRLLRWHQQHWADRAEVHYIGGAQLPEIASRPPKNVYFHGQVNRDKILKELLPTMHFFVLPTQREMSSWAGMEAMAAGLPVVLSAIGGIPDLVVEGVTGFTAKQDDDAAFIKAISSLIDDPQLCHRMGRAAQDRALAEFGRDKVYSRLMERIRELVTPTEAPVATMA